MVNPPAASLPSPTPEHRRQAAGMFDRANQVVANGSYDAGIALLRDCCKLDPSNLLYRQALRRTEKAKYRNNPDVRARKLAQRAQWLAVKDDPEHRAKRKAHLQRPDVMARRRELQRGYHKTPKWKDWKRAYAQRPDVKERQRIYRQRYRAKRRNGTGAPVILE